MNHNWKGLMKRRVSLKYPHKFADLVGKMYSEDHVLSGNTITRGQIRETLNSHFNNYFKNRFKNFVPPEGFPFDVNKVVDEKIVSLLNIMSFLFSLKKPSGLCVITDNPKSDAKTDKFYKKILDIHTALINLEEEPQNEILDFYPTFEKEYSSIVNGLDRLAKNLNTLNEYNNIQAESVMWAIHGLQMNPEGLERAEIHDLIQQAITVVKKKFPDIKQHKTKTALDQYFSSKVNSLVADFGEEGARRIKITDESKTALRNHEEAELNKRFGHFNKTSKVKK